MKLQLSFAFLAMVGTIGTSLGQSANSSNYPGLFGPANSAVTVEPDTSGLISVTIGGTASGALGTYWQANASGGAAVALSVLSVAETGAQVKLTGSALQFNLAGNPSSVLNALGAGVGGLSLSWSATATLNAPGAPFNLQPNTHYRLEFDVDKGAGLLNSTLGITPAFGVELLDSSNQVVTSSSGASLVNVLGLHLINVGNTTNGHATVDFTTGATVGTGAAKIRFTGSALVPVSLAGIGSNFATVSNLSVGVRTPYQVWIDDTDVTDPVEQDPNADPDGDGRNNLAEFAVDSNPAVPDDGNIYSAVGDPDGSGSDTSVFVMTLPVRTGAQFNSGTGGIQTSTIDGVTYQIEGSFDLINWTAAVSEVTQNSPFTANLPELSNGWTYRSFRVPGQTSDTPHAFLRAKFY